MRGEAPVVKLLAMCLADYANPEGDDIFPSIGTLADHVGVSERTVQRHIGRLIKIGFIRQVGNSRGGSMRKGADGERRGRTNRYRIDLDWWKGNPVNLTGHQRDTPPNGADTPTDGACKGDTALSPEDSIEDSISGATSKENGSSSTSQGVDARVRLKELAERLKGKHQSSTGSMATRLPDYLTT